MARLTACIAAALLALVASSAATAKPIDIVIADPADAVTNVTPAQAVETIRKIVGEPTDAPCIGSWNPYDTSTWGCTIEGWLRFELGEVFDYSITVEPIPALGGTGDACGSYRGLVSNAVTYYLERQHAASFSKGSRTMVLLMGGGGWAGHFAPTDNQVDHYGMVGDWGVMEDHGVPNGCIPDWDTPSRGFSHELAGMMGMYVGGGCYGDGLGCFVGDALSAVEKTSILRYSGQWLRTP